MTSSSPTSPKTSRLWRARVRCRLSNKGLVHLQLHAADLREAESRAIAQTAFMLRADPSTLDAQTITEVIRRP